LKKEALARSVRGTCFGRGYAPVVKQTAQRQDGRKGGRKFEIMSEWNEWMDG